MYKCNYYDISTGSIVILDRFPEIKWVVHYGWFESECSDMQNGWYLKEIPSGSIIPLTNEDMAHIRIIESGGCDQSDCYLPKVDYNHHHHNHQCSHFPMIQPIELYIPGADYNRGQLIWLEIGTIYHVANNFKASSTELSAEKNLEKDLEAGNIVLIDGSNPANFFDRISESSIDKLFKENDYYDKQLS